MAILLIFKRVTNLVQASSFHGSNCATSVFNEKHSMSGAVKDGIVDAKIHDTKAKLSTRLCESCNVSCDSGGRISREYIIKTIELRGSEILVVVWA